MSTAKCLNERQRTLLSYLRRAFHENRLLEAKGRLELRLKKVHTMGFDDEINYDRLKFDTYELSREDRASALLQVRDCLSAQKSVTSGGMFSKLQFN